MKTFYFDEEYKKYDEERQREKDSYALNQSVKGKKWARFAIKQEAGQDWLDMRESGEEPTKANTEYRPPMMINFLTEIEKEELAIKHNIF